MLDGEVYYSCEREGRREDQQDNVVEGPRLEVPPDGGGTSYREEWPSYSRLGGKDSSPPFVISRSDSAIDRYSVCSSFEHSVQQPRIAPR